MRIIAGKHKGLVLNTFDVDNIRPTTDRVRENIFNKIQFGISGSTVLDLFCGTGAISLEFISRGAVNVVSVDNNENSIKIIKQNFKKAGVIPELNKCDYKTALNKYKDTKFDYIFIDPPYHTNFGEESIRIISDYSMLKRDGVIIYEHLFDKKFELPDNYEIVDSRKYGTIMVTFIKEKSDVKDD